MTDQVELQIINVAFGQIIAVTPPALGLGAELANKQVTLRVLNVGSNKDAVLPLAFRYGPGIRINAISTNQGSALGGTSVTIFGSGFDDPVAVSIGGIAAQPIRVSGTEIVVITGAPQIVNCAPVPPTGGISVTNIEDGQTAVSTGLTFTYLVPQARITSVSPTTTTPGSPIQISVLNVLPGITRLQIGTAFVTPTNTVTDGAVTTFTATVPANLTFTTQACTTSGGAAGIQSLPTNLDIKFTNSTTGCTDTMTGALTVNPADTTCRVAAAVAVDPTSADFGPQLTTAGPTAAQTFTIRNSGGAPLTVNTVGSSNAAEFPVSGFTAGTVLAGGATTTFQVRFDPNTTGARTGTITVSTTAGNVTATTTGTGTASSATVTPAALTFPSQVVAAGPTPTQNVTVTNTGSGPVTVTALSNSNGVEFPVSGFTAGTVIAEGGTYTFQVAFDPSALGARSANLTVSTSAGGFLVTASGTGT